MSAQVWRLYGFDTHGRELVLSGLKLLGSPEAGDVSVGCSIAASHVPTAGDLAHLTDGDAATVCTWRAEDVRSPGFWIEVTLPDAADVWCAQFSLPDAAAPRVEFYGLQAVTVPASPVWYRIEVSYTGDVSDAAQAKPSGTPFGMSWNVTTAVMGNASSSVYPVCAISGDGRYLLQSNANRLYRSEDYGFSWVQCLGVIPGSLGFLGCAISADGRVQLASGGGSGGKLCISRDYGVTWAEVPGLVYGSDGGCEKCSISADGMVMCASPAGSASGRVLVSTDGGYTWSFPVPGGTGRAYNYCNVSANGGGDCVLDERRLWQQGSVLQL